MQPFFLLPASYLLGLALWLAGGVIALPGMLAWRRSRRRRGRGLGPANLLLSLWVVAAVLTTIEVGYALFADYTDSFNLTNISRRWSALHVRTNNRQFRDARPLERTSSGRRLWFAGDSFTFGQGIREVEDRFSERVQRLLAADGEPWLVNNLGLPGLDVVGVRNVVRELLAENYRPDVLVYVYCLNDIDQLDPASPAYFSAITATQPEFFLWRDTYFFNQCYFRTQQFTRPEIRNYFDVLTRSYEGEAWGRMELELAEFARVCREREIEFRLVIFPFVHNLGADYPFRFAHEKLRRFCEERAIPCLDLEPIFRRHADESLTVSRYDAHPNERAHQIAAEAIHADLIASPTP